MGDTALYHERYSGLQINFIWHDKDLSADVSQWSDRKINSKLMASCEAANSGDRVFETKKFRGSDKKRKEMWHERANVAALASRYLTVRPSTKLSKRMKEVIVKVIDDVTSDMDRVGFADACVRSHMRQQLGTLKREITGRESKLLDLADARNAERTCRFPDAKDETDRSVVLFVFYAPGPKATSGTELPAGPATWSWTGSGSTSPVNGKANASYPLEEQFNGPPEDRATMKKYLTRVYDGLKKRGIVERFKIRNSYAP
jgi:hypothetical protein